MRIQANVIRDARGNITVHMNGGLDYDHTLNVRKELLQLFEDNPYSMINFDLSGMDFVGSSGIGHFVETLKILTSRDQKKRVNVSNLRPEFEKVFKLYGLEIGQMLLKTDWDIDAESAENIATSVYHNKRRIFEN